MAKYTFEKISKSKKRPLRSRRYKKTVTGGEDKAKGGPSDNRGNRDNPVFYKLFPYVFL
jgi:hypothetical protein